MDEWHKADVIAIGPHGDECDWCNEKVNARLYHRNGFGVCAKCRDEIDCKDPLAKGEIVGKCQLCSEPYDKDDLKEADITMRCPYCGHNFDKVILTERKCPKCGVWTKDDVTIDDHGMCYDCHKDWQWNR